MKRSIFFLFIILGASGAALFSAVPASANSFPPIATTDNLSMISYDGSNNMDVSDSSDYSWFEILTENGRDGVTNRVPQFQRDFLKAAKENGSVHIYQYHIPGQNERVVDVLASLEPNQQLRYEFRPSDNYSALRPDPAISGTMIAYRIGFDGWGNSHGGIGNIIGDLYTGAQPQQVTWGRNFNTEGNQLVYYTTYGSQYWNLDLNIQIPNPGVPPLPNQPPAPTPTSDFTPLMHVQFATDWKATFVDSRFTTVDSVPFLCSGEFAPNLHFEIFDITDEEELLITGTYSASAVYEYQFTKQPLQQEFRIVAWYSCPDADIIFNQSSTRDFLIDGSGNLLRRGLNTCINETFPFLIWEDCMFAMNEIASTLMFNFHNPKNTAIDTVATQNPNNCHVLTTLDAWIYTPNQVVCPAVPKHVRDAVTPFVLFVLASVVFMYISRAKASVIS